MSGMEPSEYVPIAVNGIVESTAKFAGEVGTISIEDNVIEVANVDAIEATVDVVIVEVVVDEQPNITVIKTAKNPMVRK